MFPFGWRDEGMDDDDDDDDGDGDDDDGLDYLFSDSNHSFSIF